MQSTFWKEQEKPNVRTPVVLNWGLGVESTAILVRWLTEPQSRNFELSNLIVLTAMLGDEWPSTIKMAERYILPLLRIYQIRYVQIARFGHYEKDGIKILSDSRETHFLHSTGSYKLSKELLTNGTVPTWKPHSRKCSSKHKGFPCDTWLDREFGFQPFHHAIGFNAQEIDRVEKDTSYTLNRRSPQYPLVDWNWSREKAGEFLFQKLGVHWKKSACVFCPFSNGKPEVLQRYIEEPEALEIALQIEFVSLALNPNMALFPSGSLHNAIMKIDPDLVQKTFEAMTKKPWIFYRVQRIKNSKNVMRKVTHIKYGSYSEIHAKLLEMAETHNLQITTEANIPRIYVERRGECSNLEDMFVCAPACVQEKARPSFDTAWNNAFNPMSLFCDKRVPATFLSSKSVHKELEHL